MANLATFTIKRILAMIVVLYIIVTIVFFMAHASPYDPIRTILGQHSTAQNVAVLRHEFGLDQPMWKQYVTYLGNLLHGNLGYSEGNGTLGQSVSGLLSERAPVTMQLGGEALLLALLVGLPVGLISALKQNSWIDHSSQSVMILLYVIPAFVLVPLSQLIFGDWLQMAPRDRLGRPGCPRLQGTDPSGHPLCRGPRRLLRQVLP